MTTVSANLVKTLREKTNCGFMECKKALVESGGDIDKAVEVLRKAGIAKAEKKAGREAAEGVILLKLSSDNKSGFMVEINCETDFVAKDENFKKFVDEVLEAGFSAKATDAETLMAVKLGESQTVQEAREALISKIGENIQVRRCAFLTADDGVIGQYLHSGRAGALVALTGGDSDLANGLAMHVVGLKPRCVDESELPAELLTKEKEIYAAQVAESGKPANIVEKIVAGKIAKFINENTLVGQQFVKDPDVKIVDLLKKNNAKVAGFVRFSLGEM